MVWHDRLINMNKLSVDGEITIINYCTLNRFEIAWLRDEIGLLADVDFLTNLSLVYLCGATYLAAEIGNPP